MKYLAVLFSFYLISLTLIPCGDVADISGDEKTANSFHKDGGATENCTQEACAPFCSCSCCAIGKHFPVQAVSISIEPVLLVAHSLYSAAMPSSQPLDVWQPPKLA